MTFFKKHNSTIQGILGVVRNVTNLQANKEMINILNSINLGETVFGIFWDNTISQFTNTGRKKLLSELRLIT